MTPFAPAKLPARTKQMRPRSVRDPIGELVNVMRGEMLERRGLAAADFIRNRLPEDLPISQRVSIARALLPYLRSAAAARQAAFSVGASKKKADNRSLQGRGRRRRVRKVAA
jgi:hypothetical protein